MTTRQVANFLGLEGEHVDEQCAQVVILPVFGDTPAAAGLDAAATVSASRTLEKYDRDLDVEPWSVGIATAAVMARMHETRVAFMQMVASRASALMTTGKFLVTLTDDARLSLPVIAPATAIFPKVSVLHLGAHALLADEEPDDHSGHTGEETFLAACDAIIEVGLHDAEEYSGKPLSIPTKNFSISKIRSSGGWIDAVFSALSENVFLAVDLSVFAAMPSPVPVALSPGGLAWDEVFDLLRGIFQQKHVFACSLGGEAVRPNLHSVNIFVARTAYKIIGYKFFANRLEWYRS